MMEDTNDIVDAENQVGGMNNVLSFRSIALNQLQRILTLGSKEFHGGYWEEKTNMVGGLRYVDKKYIPDSRMEYVNAINALYDLTLPHFDDKMIKEAGVIEQKRVSDLAIYNLKDKTSSDKRNIAEVKIQRELFQALSKFMKRQNYFLAEAAEE